MHYAYQNKYLRFVASLFDGFGRMLFRYHLPTFMDKQAKNILLIKLDHLGDCFLMTPFLESLAKRFPGAAIDVVCLESSGPIFENNPFVRNLIFFNKKRAIRDGSKNASWLDFLKLLIRLRVSKYDLFIDPRGDSTAALIGFLLGICRRIGFEREEVGGFLYTMRLIYDRAKHETEKYQIILKALNIEESNWNPRLFLTDQEKESADSKIFDISKPFAAIHPGSGAPYKIFPVERWISTINFLQKRGFGMVLVGGMEDKPYADKIVTLLEKGALMHNCVGRLSLRETYALVSESGLFLGNDSVLGHFAGALGVPTVIVMNGLVDERRWRPLGGRVRVVVGKDSNHACAYHGCVYPCPHMTSISSNVILTAVKNLIG